MVSVSEDAARQYVGAILLGAVLGFVINHTYGDLISYHAAYMTSHADFYASVEGAQRWLEFSRTRSRMITAVSIGSSVLGARTILWKSRTNGVEPNPAKSYGKYVVGAFFGGFLFLILGSIVAGIVHPLPTSYSATESEVLYRNNRLKLWITVSGIGLSYLATVGSDVQHARSTIRAEQRESFDTVHQRYHSLVEELTDTEGAGWPFVPREEFDDIDSRRKRTDIVRSLEKTVDQYESLLEAITAVHTEATSLPGTEPADVEQLRNEVYRTITRGETDGLDDLREQVESERRRLADRRRKNEVLEAAAEKHPTFVTEQIRRALTDSHVNTENFDVKLDRCEQILNVSTAVQRLEQGDATVDTDAIWDIIQAVDPESEATSEVSISQLADHVDQISEIVAFLEEGRVEHLDIERTEIVRSIDNALTARSFNQISETFDRIESLRETTWSIDTLQSMEWSAFEQLVGDLWEAKGYKTTVTQGSADEGIDVIAEDGTMRVAIQAKRYKPGNKVGNRTVRNTAGVLPREFDRVIVVTTSSFTQPAQQEVVSYGEQVRLVDGAELKRLLDASDLVPPGEAS